jgi:hypothetical protein
MEELQKKSPRIFGHIQHLMARPRHLLVLVKMLQMIMNVTVLFLAVKIGVHLFTGSSYSWARIPAGDRYPILILLVSSSFRRPQ